MHEQQGPGQPARPRLVVAAGTEAGRAAGVLEAARLERASSVGRRLLDSIETVVRGKRREVTLVLTALACEGHVLFEDVPGTAKTVLARAIAQSIEGAVPSRIQCTPDLQPADVTGASIYDPRRREFEFRPGPIFANVVLLDEVNRATPKTQSALLEAMAERQVTVDGVTRPLPELFLLLATENPIEYEGTFLLPEAQLDRFFLRTALGYPEAEDEHRIVLDQRHRHPLHGVRPVATAAEVRELQRAVGDVYVDAMIQRWIVALVRATRELEIVELGASVRGSIALERAARALALLHGRDYVEPPDVEELFLPVVGHRVVFTPAFTAASRHLGPGGALAELRRRCFERAPRPLPADDHSEHDVVVDGGRATARRGLAFPLLARRRVSGLPLGTLRSSRRGPGTDLAGSRPYRPGDDVRLIDRHASARISSVAGRDELVVREHLTEEAVRVAVVVDRGPSMELFPPGLPWLQKPRAVAAVSELVAESAALVRAPVETVTAEPGANGVEGGLAALLSREAPLRAGSFVFLVSDFLVPPRAEALTPALDRRLDVVPVVVQDPVWEQSFPEVAGAVLPVADPVSGRVREALLSRREVAARRRANEERLAAALGCFAGLGLDWVLVSDARRGGVLDAFLAWAAGRGGGRRTR